MSVDLPLRATMCATCPYAPDSKYADLVTGIAVTLLDTSRICHSTGSNFINHETGIPEHLCRGARELQLRMFAANGLLQAPTDAAWNAVRLEHGMPPTITQDPRKRHAQDQKLHS